MSKLEKTMADLKEEIEIAKMAKEANDAITPPSEDIRPIISKSMPCYGGITGEEMMVKAVMKYKGQLKCKKCRSMPCGDRQRNHCTTHGYVYFKCAFAKEHAEALLLAKEIIEIYNQTKWSE